MLSAIFIDTSSSIFGSLGKDLVRKFVSMLYDWPDDFQQSINKAKGAKIAAEQSIKRIEDDFNDVLKLLTKAGELSLMRKFGSLAQELTDIRHEIEVKSANARFESEASGDKIIKAYSTVYLTLSYDSLVIQSVLTDILDLLYDDDFEVDHLFKKMRNAIANIKDSWSIFIQVTSDPKVAESVYAQLKQKRSDLVGFIESAESVNKGQMDLMASGIILEKPKVFGKKQYVENLSVVIYETVKTVDKVKISVPDLFDLLQKEHPKVKLTDDDILKAANLLITNNRAFAVTTEDNITYIEFKKSDASIVCGNCGTSGGVYQQFKKCLGTDKYVCENCITFFGKCKICGESIRKGQHPDI